MLEDGVLLLTLTTKHNVLYCCTFISFWEILKSNFKKQGICMNFLRKCFISKDEVQLFPTLANDRHPCMTVFGKRKKGCTHLNHPDVLNKRKLIQWCSYTFLWMLGNITFAALLFCETKVMLSSMRCSWQLFKATCIWCGLKEPDLPPNSQENHEFSHKDHHSAPQIPPLQ